jgi:hypothetical protein
MLTTKPVKLGTIWTARAKLYDLTGKMVASCMDTPNAIAKAFMECKEAVMVKTLSADSPYRNREYYRGRMNEWNKAESRLTKVISC